MHLILTGATGLVGSGVLDAMIRTPGLTKISILSRRPVAMADDAKDPRIHVVLHKDFASYEPSVLEQLRGASGCVWALGISQSKVSRDEYARITRDYTLAAARALATLSPEDGSAPFRFVYVSGDGATQAPGRFSPIFARVKGETETALADLTAEMPGRLRADSVRPSAVDASRHDAIRAYIPDPGVAYRVVGAVLFPVIRTVGVSRHSPTDMMGRVFTDMAMGRLDGKLEGSGAFKLGPSWIVNNPELRKMDKM